MPMFSDFCITSLMPSISPRRTRSEIIGVPSSTSTAAQRLPSRVGMRRCDTMAWMFSDRSINSCWRRSSGKKLMIRSRAWLALLACSVEMHR